MSTAEAAKADEADDTVVTHGGERQIEPGSDGGRAAVRRHRDHADSLESSSYRDTDEAGRVRDAVPIVEDEIAENEEEAG